MPGHLDVEDGQVGQQVADQLDGRVAAAGLADDLVALLLQRLAQVHADDGFVFGDHDSDRHMAVLSGRRRSTRPHPIQAASATPRARQRAQPVELGRAARPGGPPARRSRRRRGRGGGASRRRACGRRSTRTTPPASPTRAPAGRGRRRRRRAGRAARRSSPARRAAPAGATPPASSRRSVRHEPIGRHDTTARDVTNVMPDAASQAAGSGNAYFSKHPSHRRQHSCPCPAPTSITEPPRRARGHACPTVPARVLQPAARRRRRPTLRTPSPADATSSRPPSSGTTSSAGRSCDDAPRPSGARPSPARPAPPPSDVVTTARTGANTVAGQATAQGKKVVRGRRERRRPARRLGDRRRRGHARLGHALRAVDQGRARRAGQGAGHRRPDAA